MWSTTTFIIKINKWLARGASLYLYEYAEKPHSRIEMHSTVKMHSTIEIYSTIGMHSTIEMYSTIGMHSTIEMYSTLNDAQHKYSKV